MKGISRGIVKLLLVLLAALASGVALKEAVVPWLLRPRLISAVRANCGSCELSIGRVRVALLPLALSGSRVRFAGGEANVRRVEVEAERVYIPFSLLPLLKGRLRVGVVKIERSSITVTDGGLSVSSSSPAAGDKARPFDLEIAGIKLNRAAFVYLGQYPGGTARVAVTRLNAEVGPVGSSARFRGTDASASAEGLLEESGALRVQVRAKLQAEVPDLDIDLQITGQDLAKLNPFWGPADGIKLKGEVLEGRSSVAIRGEVLNSSAYLRYRGLEVKIKKNKERGAVSAFFENLLAGVIIGKQNSDGGNYDRRATAELRRKPEETVVDFSLRGMTEAALKVSAKGGS